MKESIRTLAPQFSMRRMVKEYLERMYLPAMQPAEPVKPAEQKQPAVDK